MIKYNMRELGDAVGVFIGTAVKTVFYLTVIIAAGRYLGWW
jgi:hypothetical protein